MVEHLPIMLEALGSIPVPHKPHEVVLIPALGRWEAGGSAVQGFKVILSYIVSSRPVWATEDRRGKEREGSNSDSLVFFGGVLLSVTSQ